MKNQKSKFIKYEDFLSLFDGDFGARNHAIVLVATTQLNILRMGGGMPKETAKEVIESGRNYPDGMKDDKITQRKETSEPQKAMNEAHSPPRFFIEENEGRWDGEDGD